MLGELEAAHAELERYAERVKELTVGEERARMSREMNDSLGHYLTVINVGLQNAERFREKRPEAAWAEVEEARSLTREALSKILRKLDLRERTQLALYAVERGWTKRARSPEPPSAGRA